MARVAGVRAGIEYGNHRMIHCAYCRTRKPCRPGGLCVPCYRSVEVRSLYTNKTPEGHCGHGTVNVSGVLPPEPTPHLPGTPNKLRVLEERARLGMSLWHPNDARSG